MKKINLKYCVVSYELFYFDFNKIIKIFTPTKDTHLEITLDFFNTPKSDIRKVVQLIKKSDQINQITNENIYTFVISMSPQAEIVKEIIPLRSVLTKVNIYLNDCDPNISDALLELRNRKIPVSLMSSATSFSSSISDYESNKHYGYPIQCLIDLTYDKMFLDNFKIWIMDKAGCRFNIFSDLVSKILLNYWGTECKFKSCITKYFFIDKNRNVYACKYKSNVICKFDDINSINDIYSSKKFIFMLSEAIKLREQCKYECDFFNECQGGCPFNTIDIVNCTNKSHLIMVHKIKDILIDIINNYDYREINPAVREMILSSASSNILFSKELFIEY